MLAWRNAVAVLGLLIAGDIVFTALDWPLFGIGGEVVRHLAHVGLTAVLLGVLVLRRHDPTEALAVGAAVVAVILLLPIFWWSEVAMASAGRPWTPFLGHRLVMLGVATLLPGPMGLAAGIIALFAVTAMVQYFGFGLVHQVALVNYGEPWITGLYAAVAFGIVVVRGQHRRLAQEFARSVAEADALRALAGFLLSLRDLSNTPLQTLEIDTAILERRHPEERAAIRRMRTAVGQLREISQIMAQSAPLAGRDTGRASLDPSEALRGLAASAEGRRPSTEAPR